MAQYSSDKEAAEALHHNYEKLKSEIGQVIIGQEEVVKLLLIGLFCRSHSLLLGVPGLAKTLLIQTLSEVIDLSFSRIQFTPDLMPSDILGSETLNNDRHFQFVKGPIFSNIILADEINRTPPKTQAALLEAMQENKVTIAGEDHPLPQPFFVLATQNPIEQEGTYPLPEAQLDRFMFNILLDYPDFESEVNIVKDTTSDKKVILNNVISGNDVQDFQALIKRVPIADNVVEYAVKLVHNTRPNTAINSEIANKFLEWGAGPRASQNLILAAKCHAIISGKYSPDIEDVQAIAMPILRHRIVRNFKAEAEGITVEKIIKDLF